MKMFRQEYMEGDTLPHGPLWEAARVASFEISCGVDSQEISEALADFESAWERINGHQDGPCGRLGVEDGRVIYTSRSRVIYVLHCGKPLYREWEEGDSPHAQWAGPISQVPET